YPIHVPSWAAPQDLSGAWPPGPSPVLSLMATARSSAVAGPWTWPHETLLVKSLQQRREPQGPRDQVPAAQSVQGGVCCAQAGCLGARRCPGRHSWPWRSGAAAGASAPTPCRGYLPNPPKGWRFTAPPGSADGYCGRDVSVSGAPAIRSAGYARETPRKAGP